MREYLMADKSKAVFLFGKTAQYGTKHYAGVLNRTKPNVAGRHLSCSVSALYHILPKRKAVFLFRKTAQHYTKLLGKAPDLAGASEATHCTAPHHNTGQRD